MIILDWPAQFDLRFASHWELDTLTTSATGISRQRAGVTRENRFWRGSFLAYGVWRGQEMAWQGFMDELRGSYGIIRLPFRNAWTRTYGGDPAGFYSSLGITQADVDVGSLPYEEGERFSDGSGWALPDYAEPVAQDTAPAGAREITLQGFLGEQLSGYFTHNGYLYRVASNDFGRITFNPPLRSAIEAGEAVQVSNPVVHVHLASDEVASEISRTPWGRPIRLNVIEAFQR